MARKGIALVIATARRPEARGMGKEKEKAQVRVGIAINSALMPKVARNPKRSAKARKKSIAPTVKHVGRSQE